MNIIITVSIFLCKRVSRQPIKTKLHRIVFINLDSVRHIKVPREVGAAGTPYRGLDNFRGTMNIRAQN